MSYFCPANDWTLAPFVFIHILSLSSNNLETTHLSSCPCLMPTNGCLMWQRGMYFRALQDPISQRELILSPIVALRARIHTTQTLHYCSSPCTRKPKRTDPNKSSRITEILTAFMEWMVERTEIILSHLVQASKRHKETERVKYVSWVLYSLFNLYI